MVIATLMALAVSLLMLAGVQADNMADRSRLQGFLSKPKGFYAGPGADRSQTAASDYDKFITPNFQHMHSSLAEHVPAAEDYQAKAAENMFANDSSMAIPLCAIGIVMSLGMLGFSFGGRIRRVVQRVLDDMRRTQLLGPHTAAVLASSGGRASDMTAPMALNSGDNTLELETGITCKENSSRVGWGQMASQNPSRLTLCSATPPGISGPDGFFNPLCTGDCACERCGKCKYSCECELKHGRIAMCTAAGFPVLRQFRAAALAAGLAAAPLAAFADGQTDKFALPPINKTDKTRCVFKDSKMGQSNGAKDKLFDFRECDMSGKKADNYDLAGAIMSDANFTGASFKETVMSKAYARDSNFKDADFTNGVVDRVSFDKSDLRGAIFQNTVLTGASFQDSNLENVDFTEAFIGDFDLRKLCKNPTLTGENAKTGAPTRASAGCK